MKKVVEQLYQIKDAYEEKNRILRSQKSRISIDEKEIKNKFRKELDYPAKPKEPTMRFPDEVKRPREPKHLPKDANDNPNIIGFKEFDKQCTNTGDNLFKQIKICSRKHNLDIKFEFIKILSDHTITDSKNNAIEFDPPYYEKFQLSIALIWCVFAAPFIFAVACGFISRYVTIPNVVWAIFGVLLVLVPFIRKFRADRKTYKYIMNWKKLLYEAYKKYMDDYHNDYKKKLVQYNKECDIIMAELNKKEIAFKPIKDKYNAEVEALEAVVQSKADAEIERICAENDKIDKENYNIEQSAEDAYRRMTAGNPIADDFPENYFSRITELADLINKGRADTLKEAINLYEDIQIQNQKLEEERERTRLEQKRLEEAREAAEEARRDRERAADEARRDRERAADEARRDRERAENERKYEAEREAVKARSHCVSCMYYTNCNKRHNITQECASYMPR